MEKKKSNVVYTVTIDPETGLPTEILESVIAIARPDPLTGAPEQYYIFSTRYRMADYGEVERFDVPAEAVPLLR